MTTVNYPLLDLFTQLRRYGLPLGVDDYLFLLRALQAGFGIKDQQALKRLCCTLWTKSEDDVRIFDRLYQLILEEPIASPAEILLNEVTEQKPENQPVQLSENFQADEPVSKANRYSNTPQILSVEEEPSQVVRTIRSSQIVNESNIRSRFSIKTDYFPVTPRQMKQCWRHLRRMVRVGLPEELDIPSTIKKIAQLGVVADLVLMPKRLNRAKLILLIDHDGSMIPFHALTRQLIETVQRDGRLGNASIFYFHDFPDDYLYKDVARLDALRVDELLASIDERTSILIISDAGAARGRYSSERVHRTKEFIQKLKQTVRYYAWLNPLPRDRWFGNTAGEIASVITMYEMSRVGLDSVIGVLRGQYRYFLVDES